MPAAESNLVSPGAEAPGRGSSAPDRPATEPPVVSVVINCHNYEQFLPGAIDSVLAQTYRDFEVIIVDDASTDGSRRVAAAAMAANRSGIPMRLLTLNDVGPSAARRAGFAAGRGRFLLPLDADDKIAPTFLARTAAVLERHATVGFAYTDMVYFGDVSQHHRQPEYDPGRLLEANYVAYCSLIRRAAFEAVGGYDPANWGYYEDWDLWIRLGEAGWRGERVPEPLFLYHHHFSSSLSLYSGRLGRLYRAYLITRHPHAYEPGRVEEARRIVAELPGDWPVHPPLREAGRIEPLLAQYPDNPHLLFLLASAQARAGDADAARATFNRLLQRQPGDEQARRALGELARAGRMARPPAGVNADRIVALMSTYNEGDIIFHVLGDLIENGVDVYLIDNGSVDNTVAEASRWVGRGLIAIERFPEDTPTYSPRCAREYVWGEILRRKEELAAQLGAAWYLHVDADEFRESPWPDRTLAEAIREVDRLGYNAINFELLNFRPTDDAFRPGSDVRQHLTSYEPGELFDSVQIKAWKNTGALVEIAASGGHSVAFSGRRLFPLNFILRHYPIRGETHGQRKVYGERLPRFAREEVARQWHIQYNGFVAGKERFLRAASELVPYDAGRVRAALLGRFSADVLLASTLSRGCPFSGRIVAEELRAWTERRVGRPVAPEHLAAAEKVLTSLLRAHQAAKEVPAPQISPGMATLLHAVLEAQLVIARLNGNPYFATVAARVARLLAKLASAGAPQRVEPARAAEAVASAAA